MTSSLVRGEDLLDRVLATFPSGGYCLPALFRLMKIETTEAVETASVECTSRPRLFINPRFVEQHAATPERLLMLVMHELHHVILGHTRLYPRGSRTDNLVFDAVINAMLCQLYPQPEYTSLFTAFYSDAKFPECFLRPPAAWRFDEDVPPSVPPALQEPERADLAALYCSLYTPPGATYSELRTALAPWIAPVAADFPVLLGDHTEEEAGESSSSGGLEDRAPVLLDEIRRIVERWPRPKDPVTGRSTAELLDGAIVRTRRSSRSQLQGLLRLIGRGHGPGQVWDCAEDPVLVQTGVPSWDRRALVAAGLGWQPLLYAAGLTTRRRRPTGHRVHVYLDVSGSIGPLVGPLYGAVLACGDLVHPVVHLFSTAVSDARLPELTRGVCRSTGGTDIACVAAHIKAQGVRRAVLVTDGFVGRPGLEHAQVLRAIRLGVALTPGPSTRADLEGLADQWVTLDEVRR